MSVAKAMLSRIPLKAGDPLQFYLSIEPGAIPIALGAILFFSLVRGQSGSLLSATYIAMTRGCATPGCNSIQTLSYLLESLALYLQPTRGLNLSGPPGGSNKTLRSMSFELKAIGKSRERFCLWSPY